MILGTINEVDNENGVTLVVDGETSPTAKKYSYLSSYSPTAGDRVLIEEISDTYVIIGKLTNNFDDSGKVRYAETAGNATHATSATSATSATTATTATKLDSSAGSTSTPIYFSNGKPTALTGVIDNQTAGAAAFVYNKYYNGTGQYSTNNRIDFEYQGGNLYFRSGTSGWVKLAKG